MSDTLFKFIPQKPTMALSVEQQSQISSWTHNGMEMSVEVNSIVQFADAGANFESVACPFCQADLMEWWGAAMGSAFSDTDGFSNRSVTTPCCNKATTLNDLIYDWPQGFYRSMVTLRPLTGDVVDSDAILHELDNITGQKWRMVISHI